VLDKTGSLAVGFPVQIIYRSLSYRIHWTSLLRVVSFCPRTKCRCL